jgi:glycerophosphoryl diester phosphodiesterase
LSRLADPFRIIAHRAASGHAPENTMAALERVVAMGCVEVETDVCFAKDGRLLLPHDDTIDRTTDGSGRPEDFTLDELKRLDAESLTDERLSRDRDYSGENPITPEERLDAFGTALTYHVEIKNPTPGLVPATIAVDDDAPLQEAMRLAPVIRVACPTLPADGPRAIRRCAAAEIGCNGIKVNWPDWLMDHARSLGGDGDGR